MKRLPRSAVAFAAMLAISAATLGTWAATIPPFEAPDEIWFARVASGVDLGQQVSYDPAFFHIARRILHAAGGGGVDFEARRNPAFRFVGNRRGEVNMFLHGDLGTNLGPAPQRIYVLRALVIAVTTATIGLIYWMALVCFGSQGMAALTAGLCLLIPQFTFMGAVVHPEAVSTLCGAFACTVLILRLASRIGRTTAALGLIPVLAATPFADAAAFFLFAFVPLAFVIVEPRPVVRRLMAAAAIATAAGAVLVARAERVLIHGPLRDVLRDERVGVVQGLLRDPLAPFAREPDTLRYFAYEFTPNIFVGFWGWLGQPSILLPAPVYGAIAASSIVAAAGLMIVMWQGGVTRTGVSQRRLVALTIVGVVAMLVPIAYATMLLHRNAWYGRWLFPLVGPMMITLIVGFRRAARPIIGRPALAAGWIVAAAVLAVVWLLGPGDAFRAAIRANHYGDQQRLIRTSGWTIAFIAAIPALLAAAGAARRRSFRVSPRIGGATTVVATAWALNLLLLFAYVRPLYRPVLLDERAYRDAIRRELDRGDLLRASSIAELAADLFPRSQDFAELAPALLLQERQNPYFFKLMRDFLERRLDAGHMLSSRGEIVAIAHFLRERAWRDADRRRLLETADVLAQRRDQVPNAALLRLALVTHPSEELAALALLARVGLTKVEQEIPGRARIESFSVYEFPDGRSQILVCFRPEFPRRPRQLWLHAYPEGSRAYVDVAPIPRGYQAWDTGQLSWEIFELPDAARYNVYVGVMMDGDLGPAVHLGWFGRDGAKQASGR